MCKNKHNLFLSNLVLCCNFAQFKSTVNLCIDLQNYPKNIFTHSSVCHYYIYMLQICGGLCDRRANKAFQLDLALLTSLECTSNSGFPCYNTENTIHKLIA